jgi:hypothetical protein
MEKIIFADIFDTEYYNGDWLPYYSGVYIIKNNDDWSNILHPDFDGTDYEFTGFSKTQILNISVDNDIYQDVSTTTNPQKEVINNEGTYYFDLTERLLYVHFRGNIIPWSLRTDAIEIGILQGFYKTSTFVDQYALSQKIQGQIFEDRLISTPASRTTLDDFFFSKPKYINGNIEIDNTDRKYQGIFVGKERPESLSELSKIGNIMRVYQWEGKSILNDMTWEELQSNIIYQGYIDKGSEDYGEPFKVRFSVRDIRNNFNIKSPSRQLDPNDWPDLKNPGRPVDLQNIWGKASSIPCVCLNEADAAPTDFTFLLGDSEKRPFDEITAVYVDDERLNITAPTITRDLVKGISYFTVDDAQFWDGSKYVGLSKVTVDVNGYCRNDAQCTLIENTLEIVRTMLLDELGYTYSEAYFELDEWQAVEDTAPNGAYYVKKPTELYKRIADLQTNLPGTKWDVTAQRRMTWKDFRYTGQDTVFEIDDTMLPRGFQPTLAIESDEVLAKFRVGYQKKWKTQEEPFAWYEDNRNEDFAESEYRTSASRDFETNLVDEADAQNAAEIIYNRTSIADNSFSVSIDSVATSKGIKASQLRAGHYIGCLVNLDAVDLIGRVVCQVEKQENKDGRVSLDLRVEQQADGNYINNKYLILTVGGVDKYLEISGLPLILGA